VKEYVHIKSTYNRIGSRSIQSELMVRLKDVRYGIVNKLIKMYKWSI